MDTFKEAESHQTSQGSLLNKHAQDDTACFIIHSIKFKRYIFVKKWVADIIADTANNLKAAKEQVFTSGKLFCTEARERSELVHHSS